MKPIEHIVLSAFLHDICKAYEENDYIKTNEHFCELLKNKFKILAINKDDHENWLNLTRDYYKKDESNQYISHNIIKAADYFASAEREEGFCIGNQDLNKRLIPILERVDLKNKNRKTSYNLPRTKLSFDDNHLFPFEGDRQTPKEKVNIFDMIEDIQAIPDFKNDNPNNASTQIKCITRFLLSIFEKYISQIPANISTETPDVSLFDHLRITAAIAQGLFEYHKDKKDLDKNPNFKDKDTSKWLLVCGDFAGIQNFIYKLTSEKAAKGLKGRSIYIQLLCDVSAQYLIKSMDLFPTSLIYSSGGKFYILIPNTNKHKEILEQSTAIINSWLLNEFRGEMYLGIGHTEVSGESFEAGAMGIKWKEANESLQKNRLQKFSHQIIHTSDFFKAQDLNSGNHICQACSRNDVNAEIDADEKIKKCKQCKNLENVGKNLTNVKYFLWVWNQDIDSSLGELEKLLFSFESETMTCKLYFLSKRPSQDILEQLTDYSLEIINDPDEPKEFGHRFIGKWNTLKSKVTEFHKFAEQSEGINRLGILRMDVDNLGEIFVRGLDFLAVCGKEMGSLSRIATMSRQLNIFFSGYLNKIIKDYNQTKEEAQIIYSGGDDLFIIGSWHAMPDIANHIQQKFKEYCCHNPFFTLSAGISMVTEKYPIYNAAMIAGKDESRAKNIGEIVADLQNQPDAEQVNKKDALCFMGSVIGWKDYESVISIKELIINIIEQTNSRSIIDRLNTVILTIQMFEQRKKAEQFSLKKIFELVYFQKWRWQLIYNLHRMASKYSDDDIKKNLKKLEDIILNTDLKKRLPVLNWLEMPVRWADFLTRKEKTDGKTTN